MKCYLFCPKFMLCHPVLPPWACCIWEASVVLTCTWPWGFWALFVRYVGICKSLFVSKLGALRSANRPCYPLKMIFPCRMGFFPPLIPDWLYYMGLNPSWLCFLKYGLTLGHNSCPDVKFDPLFGCSGFCCLVLSTVHNLPGVSV